MVNSSFTPKCTFLKNQYSSQTMLCSSAWGEQLTPLWEFCGIPGKCWTTDLRSYHVLQHGAMKPAVQHSGANTEMHGQALPQVCPRSIPAEGSAMSKAPGTNSSVHCCCSEITLPAHGQWDKPHHLSFEKSFPNPYTKFPKLLLWGFGALCKADQTTETEASPRWLKHTFIFTCLTKQHPNVQERKVHKGASISWAMICIIFTMCPLLDINTYSSPLPVHVQWPPYQWQERLYTSNSEIKHSSSLTATIQPNTMWGNSEANRRNYLYFQLRHDPGGSMEANPYPQNMDLVPFPNMPGSGEHPQLQHLPHKTLHPRYNHRSATRDTTIISTSNCQTQASATFSQCRFMEVTVSMHPAHSTFMSQSFNLPSGMGRKL